MFRPLLLIASLILSLHRAFGLHFEITLGDKLDGNGTVHVKLTCRPTSEPDGARENRSVLWEGSRFGMSGGPVLATGGQLILPDIRVNSSDRYRCVLASPESGSGDKKSLAKRVLRQIKASVPAEFGSCWPGYRLDQDRCYPCFPGSYSSGQEISCYLCPRDFYMNREAADSCWPCPDGKNTVGEGADSEDMCFVIGSDGKPNPSGSTKWIILGTCIAIAIFTGIIIALLLMYCKTPPKKERPKITIERVDRMEGGLPSPTPTTDDSDHIYHSISDDDSHIYEEIGPGTKHRDDDSHYEVPIRRKPNEGIYTELVPHEDDGYEVPIRKKPNEGVYTKLVPHEDDGYEVPIRKKRKEGVYTAVADDDEDSVYEKPIHVYGAFPESMQRHYSSGFESSRLR